MTAPAQALFYADLRPQWYIRQMAQGFGSLYRDRKASGTWWVIECWIKKKRYRLRGFRTISGRLVKFTSRAAAAKVLEEIRDEKISNLSICFVMKDRARAALHSETESGCERDAKRGDKEE